MSLSRVLAYPARADGAQGVTIGSQSHGREENSPEGGAGDAAAGAAAATAERDDGDGQAIRENVRDTTLIGGSSHQKRKLRNMHVKSPARLSWPLTRTSWLDRVTIDRGVACGRKHATRREVERG